MKVTRHGSSYDNVEQGGRSGMTVGFGADDAGYELKSMLLAEIRTLPGMTAIDFGVSSADAPEPYPQVGVRVAEAVARGEIDRAILVCGTGIGMAISANKVPGVRAAVAYDAYSVERSILSNNCQVLALGARVIGGHLAMTIVRQWLALRFDEASPSSAKLAMLEAYENTGHPVGGHQLEDAPAC
jgi:ribose 5-phosphate isomerase B